MIYASDPDAVLDAAFLAGELRHLVAGTTARLLDRRLAEAPVTNPWGRRAGQGPAIVLAELGRCRFHGEAVRDPRLSAGSGARSRRAEHCPRAGRDRRSENRAC